MISKDLKPIWLLKESSFAVLVTQFQQGRATFLKAIFSLYLASITISNLSQSKKFYVTELHPKIKILKLKNWHLEGTRFTSDQPV